MATWQERHAAASHAMQSGAQDQAGGSNDGSPKHLRVGVNVALCDHAALVGLLISKGLITEEEYGNAMASAMEGEVRRYEERLSEAYGVEVKLY